MHYRAQLRKRLGDEYYSVIVASMTADDEDTPYQLGVALARYFDARGGFTIRNRAQEFIVFLPYATPEESQEMVSDFVEKELRGREFDASATMNVGISMGRRGRDQSGGGTCPNPGTNNVAHTPSGGIDG